MSEQYVNVYRIEKGGQGPFRYPTSFQKELDDALNIEHPTPHHDVGINRKWLDRQNIKDYRFGSPCPSSLKGWIKKPEVLQQLGFKVALYKVKKDYVHSSEIQSMFIKRHSKKVMEWDLEKFCRDI